MVQLVEITGVLNEKGCIEIPIVLLAQTGIRTGEEVNLIYLAAGEKDYRNESSNPNFKEGVNPHIWTDSGKSDWYVFRPGAAEYQKVADTLENYMSVFQDMVMAQAEQDCTIQMGT